MSPSVLPVRGRTAGGSRPALATGVFLLLASLALPVPPPSGPPDAPSFPSATAFTDVLVQGAGAATAVAAAGGQPLAHLPIVDGLLARVPTPAAARLAGRPGIRAVTDADRPLRVRAAALPEPGTGPAPHNPPPGGAAAGRGVGVAVLDTGIAAAGDLAGRVVASADLSGEWSFSDSYGHGTFMAGLIAGSGRGGGPAGVAPGADLVDLKVAGADGSTTLGQVVVAMQLAAASRERFNLRVLNISLGAPADDPATAPLTEAVERLWADGITVVAAAGNDGGGVDAPGLDPYVVTVGAVDGPRPGAVRSAPATGAVPAWSSRGPDRAGRAKPDLVAPGVGVVSLRAPGSTIDRANQAARVGDDYFRGSGTSMSTALVAGAAARLAAAHPDWGPDQLKAALTGTASPLGRPAPAGSGAGALDLDAALGLGSVRPANADLPGLPVAGRGGAPPGPGKASGGWRPGAWKGLRWFPGLDAGGRGLQALETFLRSEVRLLARSWLARSWLTQGWTARSWMARSWDAATS